MTTSLSNKSDQERYAEVLVSTTWDCNLRCSYCFVNETEITSQKGFMSPEIAERVIDALDEGLSEVNRISVHLYGGEPFLNLPAVEAMINRALEKKKGRFMFVATTNGTVLNDKLIELINKIRFTVLVSIDGPEEIHDECRKFANGTPSHKRVVNFIETLREKTDCRIYGGAVIRSGWRLKDAYDYLRTLPVDDIKAQAVRLPPGTPFALTKEEWERYKDDIEAVGRSVIEDLEKGEIPRDKRFSPRVLQLLVKGKKSHFCAAGHTSFGITPKGEVLACLLVKGPGAYMGHINDDPKTWREAGRKWRDKPLREKCVSCKHLNLCAGGCPAIFPVCGDEECDIIYKNCEVTHMIYDHFEGRQEFLMPLAGITD